MDHPIRGTSADLSRRLLKISGLTLVCLGSTMLGWLVATSQKPELLTASLTGLAILALVLWRAAPPNVLRTWFLTIPILGLFVIGMPPGIPDLTFYRLMTALVIAVLAARSLGGRMRPLPLDAPSMLLLTYVFITGINLLLRPSPSGMINMYIMFFDTALLPVLVFIFARFAIATQQGVECILKVVPVITLANIVEALVQESTRRSTLLGTSIPLNSEWAPLISGFLAAWVELSVVIVTLFPLNLFFALHGKNRLQRTLAIVATGLSPLVIFLAAARVGWIAFVLSGLFIGLRRRRTLLLILLGIVVAVLILVNFLPETTQYYLVWKQNIDSPQDRLVLNLVALRTWLASPLVGAGTQGADLATERGLSGGLYWGHNTWLWILADYGLLGFWPLAVAIVLCLRRSMQWYRSCRNRDWRTSQLIFALWASMLGWSVFALMNELRHFRVATSLFFLLLAILVQGRALATQKVEGSEGKLDQEGCVQVPSERRLAKSPPETRNSS